MNIGFKGNVDEDFGMFFKIIDQIFANLKYVKNCNANDKLIAIRVNGYYSWPNVTCYVMQMMNLLQFESIISYLSC